MSIQSTECADNSLDSGNLPSVPSDYGSNASSHNGEGLLATFTEGVREHYLKCLEHSLNSIKQCSLRKNTLQCTNSAESLCTVQDNTGALFAVLLDILSVTEGTQKKTLLNKSTDSNVPMKYFVSQALTFDKELLHKLEEISSGCRILSNSLNTPAGELEPIYHATALLFNKLQTYLHCYNDTFINISASSPKKQSKRSVEKKNSFSSSESFYSAREEFQCEMWFEEELGEMWGKYCEHSETICRTIKPNM